MYIARGIRTSVADGNTLARWGAGVAEVSRTGGWDGVLDPEAGVGGGGASG
jgi:hypothetical protein